MGQRRSNEIEIEGGSMFSEKMRRAQKAYCVRDWKAFKQIFEGDKKELLNNFDLVGNHALSIAIRSRDRNLFKDLLEMLSEEERWLALTKPSRGGNTILHSIAARRRVYMEIIDFILDYEKEAAAALPEEENKRRGPKLLERKNRRGETPLFRAAAFGNLKMLHHVFHKEHFAEAAQSEGDALKIHQYSNTETILHASINAQHFGL
ncbi:uncharacterized protein LOC114736002 [Neltuma alba]|uniref:uncharacterized protein LOC114714665 n=1 Tax=Neltuma alba TaxID=207710 RepID=UPI0010A589B0|nr:uncharacterized protein LOC114714665 [Prosopis alba]XP_028779626.1 uncharacterized protein LOC114736002 [Prosopis alba]